MLGSKEAVNCILFLFGFLIANKINIISMIKPQFYPSYLRSTVPLASAF